MTTTHSRFESAASNYTETATLAGTPQPSTFLKPVTAQIGTQIPVPQFLPPDHPDRTLVLCFDGTGDQFDSDNSNIVELFSMLKKDDPSQQLVYYQAGIGTYTSPQIATPMFAKFSKAVDEAVAWNLDSHIMGGYEFIMQNYRARDKICIFGFSRGAYTARCLAGMIHKVGLLPTCNLQQVPFAYKMYTRTDEVGWKQSNAFKRAFSMDVDIHFLGVWDTVASVGLIPRRLPFTTSNTVVGTFRHALALDERRSKFQPNTWNWPTKEEELLSVTDQQIAKQKAREMMRGKKTGGKGEDPGTWKILEEKYGKSRAARTDIEEVWFAGCHCDIGGGSVANGVRPCLARIPLRWMIRECFKTNSGIIFHTEGIARIGINPATLCPVALARPPALPLDTSSPETCIVQKVPKVEPAEVDDYEGDEEHTIESLLKETEEEADRKDALAPVYDQLSLSWFWWVLELIPLRHRYQRSNGVWTHWFWPNLGNGRRIPGQEKRGVKVHRSVKTRMEADFEGGGKYHPRANMQVKYVTWID